MPSSTAPYGAHPFNGEARCRSPVKPLALQPGTSIVVAAAISLCTTIGLVTAGTVTVVYVAAVRALVGMYGVVFVDDTHAVATASVVVGVQVCTLLHMCGCGGGGGVLTRLSLCWCWQRPHVRQQMS